MPQHETILTSSRPAARQRCLMRLLTSLVFVAVCLGGPTSLPAHADEQLVFLDLQDHALDQFSLLEAALQIGGFDHADSVSVSRALAADILNDSASGSTRTRIERILTGMRAKVMTGQYDPAATQLPVMLRTGNYNCVSAATVFLGLAEISHVAARGVLLPGHLACRVWIPEEGQWIDLEPTQATRNAVPDSSTRGGRELTPVEVLAKLYYNRGIELLAERDYYPALRCAELSVALDPAHEAARDSLAAVAGQWTFEMCQQHRFEDAASVLTLCRRQLPRNSELVAHEIHVQAMWIQDLARRGRVADAERQLARALESHPESDLLQNTANVLRRAVLAP